MAAQLINNLTTRNQPASGPTEDDLRRLMQEVSEVENSMVETNDPLNLLENKHKLIYILTLSVLERLSASGDPFINLAPFLSHASDVLDVFMVTIKEFPAVLDYVLPMGVNFYSRGQEPLWLWLFPRVLTLLGRQGCESLTDKIKDFFFVSFQVVSKNPRLWNLNSFFFIYLKECVASMSCPFFMTKLGLISIDILHHLALAKAMYSKKVDITLPTGEADYRLFFTNSDESRSGEVKYCTYTIQDSVDGFCQAMQILLVLVDISMEAASSYDATPAFSDYMAWMLTSFANLHDIYQKWQANPSLYRECPNPDSLFFYSLHALMSSIKASLSPTLLRKGYTILSILCSNVLQDQSQYFEQSNQVAICGCLLNLASVCEKYDSLRRFVSLHLVPVVKSTLGDESAVQALGKDFQVSLLLIFPSARIDHSQNARPALNSCVISARVASRKLLIGNSTTANFP